MAKRRYSYDWDLIHKMYQEEQLVPQQIAEELGCSPNTIARGLARMNCKRTRSEAQQLSMKLGRWKPRFGKDNPVWKGGKFIDNKDGYVHIWNGELQGYIPEHRFIWEQVHNRKLPNSWIIHHLNGIRTDNRPCNLIAMSRGEHIHLAEPYKQRIRELELENKLLEKALDNSQMIFRVSDN